MYSASWKLFFFGFPSQDASPSELDASQFPENWQPYLLSAVQQSFVLLIWNGKKWKIVIANFLQHAQGGLLRKRRYD